ncbi:MAG: TonB family protein [Gammaproteobacteria bacterium]|nr:TonB family protein [Gammaproteobacteria bacterium]
MDMIVHTLWHNTPSHHLRMMLFLLYAVLLHGLVFYILHSKAYDARPQLPDWMNIKLVAGIDLSDNKTANPLSTKKTKPEPIKSNKLQQQQEPESNPEQLPSEAQHFIKADSRPFEHENPKPFYPSSARRRGMEGTVLLQVEVNERGKVSHVELKKSSGYRLLDSAAIDTVSKWFFIPAQKGKTPVKSLVEIPVKFELKNL